MCTGKQCQTTDSKTGVGVSLPFPSFRMKSGGQGAEGDLFSWDLLLPATQTDSFQNGGCFKGRAPFFLDTGALGGSGRRDLSGRNTDHNR